MAGRLDTEGAEMAPRTRNTNAFPHPSLAFESGLAWPARLVVAPVKSSGARPMADPVVEAIHGEIERLGSLRAVAEARAVNACHLSQVANGRIRPGARLRR